MCKRCICTTLFFSLKMDKEETEYMLKWSEHNPQVMTTFYQVSPRTNYEEEEDQLRIIISSCGSRVI